MFVAANRWSGVFRRPLLDKRITNFSRFNEPHYEDYVGADLGQMFMDAGLQPYLKTVSSATKVLSFTKCA